MRSNLICEAVRPEHPRSMATPDKTSAAWTEDLVRFLQSQPGIAAVRVNPTDRKVSVATLGPVDTAQLAEHIAEVLRAIEHKLAEGGKGTAAPAGLISFSYNTMAAHLATSGVSLKSDQSVLLACSKILEFAGSLPPIPCFMIKRSAPSSAK